MSINVVSREALRYAAACVFGSEGFRADAYFDRLARVPRWTIGHGTTLINGKPVQAGMCCTLAEANAWAAADMSATAAYIVSRVNVPLNIWQLGALISFTYNLGVGTFARSDVLVSLNRGHYETAADHLLQYNHAGGVVIAGLTARRERERALFLCADLKSYLQRIARPTPPPPVSDPDNSADALNAAELALILKAKDATS